MHVAGMGHALLGIRHAGLSGIMDAGLSGEHDTQVSRISTSLRGLSGM